LAHLVGEAFLIARVGPAVNVLEDLAADDAAVAERKLVDDEKYDMVLVRPTRRGFDDAIDLAAQVVLVRFETGRPVAPQPLDLRIAGIAQGIDQLHALVAEQVEPFASGDARQVEIRIRIDHEDRHSRLATAAGCASPPPLD